MNHIIIKIESGVVADVYFTEPIDAKPPAQVRGHDETEQMH